MLLIHQNTSKSEEIPHHSNMMRKEIVSSVFCVHKELRPGLLERIYEVCLAHELTSLRLGYLINFKVINNGRVTKRIVN